MTADQKKYAEDFLAENPNVKELFLNPSGEWFTNKSYAMNSLPKNKEGEREGEIDSVKAKAEKTTPKK
jgi:hypothetical protein